MSKIYFLIPCFFFFLLSCKTTKDVVEDDIVYSGLQKDKLDLAASNQEEGPQNLLELFKVLALTEAEVVKFKGIYGDYANRISRFSSDNADDATKFKGILGLKKERDLEIYKFLNEEQDVIYRRFVIDRVNSEIGNKNKAF